MNLRAHEYCLFAHCADSSEVSRRLIIVDEVRGVISEVIKESDANFNAVYNEAKNLNKLTVYDDQCLLFAAFGDVHIHAREDQSGLHLYKEDFESVRAAALNGGVLFACDMPNNPVAPIDDETYLEKAKLTLKNNFALLPYAGIGPETRPLQLFVPYKVYIGHSVGNLFFKNQSSLDNVLKYYQNAFVSFHCEDPEILDQNVNEEDHFKRRPIEAEVSATKIAIDLVRKHQLRAKFCHYSSGEGLSLIKKARAEGLFIQTEVTPQHLYFSEEEIRALDNQAQTEFQMNPPIRKKYDRELLLKALIHGEIDFLATDHAPHAPHEKEKGMSGLTGLDTYASFVTWLLVTMKVDPKIIALVCAENPGIFYNRFHEAWLKNSVFEKVRGDGIGFIKAGHSASFTILDLANPTTIKKEMLKTKAANSPFLNKTFPGSLKNIYFNGEKISFSHI